MVERSFLVVNPKEDGAIIELSKLIDALSDGYILDPMFNSKPLRLENSVIYHIAKFTEEELAELEKEPVESKIVSVRSVELDGVDELLKEGYTVHALYAKNAVLTKKEVVDETGEKKEA